MINDCCCDVIDSCCLEHSENVLFMTNENVICPFFEIKAGFGIFRLSIFQNYQIKFNSILDANFTAKMLSFMTFLLFSFL